MIGTQLVPNEQVDTLRHFVPKGGSFLEIGTAAGFTAAKMASHAKLVVCIDIFCDLDHPDVRQLDGDRWTAWRLNTPPSVRLWRGDLASFRALCNCRFNLVFIDADHTLPNVAYDLADAAEIADTLAVHDYGEPAWPDVRKAVDAFCNRYGWRPSEQVGSLVILRRS